MDSLALDHVNDTCEVLLQISRGIFVCDEIIQMHITHESNHTVAKLPRNGNSKAKKINKKYTSVYRNCQAQPIGWMHMTIFT